MSLDEASVARNVRTGSETEEREYTCLLLPYSGPFASLVDVPTTVPLVEDIIGTRNQLDAMHYMSRAQGQGSCLHHGYAELLAYSESAVNRDRFECGSIKISYALIDAGSDGGSFVVIPGSHKSSFANPDNLELPDADHPLVEPVQVRAGDAVLFSEDFTHGALVHASDRIRPTIFVSYAPAFHSAWYNRTETAAGFQERALAHELVRGGASPMASAPCSAWNLMRLS